PTDAAMLIFARRACLDAPGRVLGEQPFTSARRMASVLVGIDARVRAYVRGAPEALLERATHVVHAGAIVAIEDSHRRALLDQAATWANASMRVIALG